MLHRPIRNAPVEARIGFLGYQARACGFELEIQREQFTGEKTVVDLDLPEARSMPNALSLRDRLGQAVSSELVVDYSRGLIIHNEGPDLLEVKTWENPVQAQLLAFSHLMCWLRKFPVYPLSYWPIMPQTVAGLHVCMETFVDFTQHQLLENYPAWFQLLSFVVSFLSPGLITKQGERLVLYANNRAHLLLNLVYDVDPLQNLITTRSKYIGYAKPNSRLVHFSCCPPYSATNFFILVTSLHCLLCMIESPNERLKAFLKNPVVDEGPV
ncbi:MAG: hypothetical protein NZO16_08115, partial [Deltaproteobacteria bacterium]|nr:hypothetical protein [Deltaproteobacteria bacterium]